MASLIPRGKAWAIQWTDRRRKRRTISLGVMPKRAAQHVHRHVENLIGSYLAAAPLEPETARWLGEVADFIRERIVENGLIPGVEPNRHTLGQVCRASYAARESGMKLAVRKRVKHTHGQLIECLGDREVSEITEADAKRFRGWLLAKGLSEATVRKRCSDARVCLGWAVDARLIEANPFTAVPTTTTAQVNPSYVSEADALRVMAELPDTRWRLLFALGRWGGLRIPSEASSLTWDDILWDKGRFRVVSTKTENQGKAERFVPLFPELVPLFREQFEHAPVGEPRVLPSVHPTATGGQVRNVLLRAIRRAGLEPWSDLWRTLRASRQTDLEARFPLQTVCNWLGNSTTVARRHYLRITDDHWRAAAGAAPNPERALHEALHRPSTP